MTLSGDAADDAPGPELTRLLADLREVFGRQDVLWTRTILARLHPISGAPLADWHGKPLTGQGLAGLLRPYGVKPKDVREGGYPAQNLKGYERSQFTSLWQSYPGPGGSAPGQPGPTCSGQRGTPGPGDKGSGELRP